MFDDPAIKLFGKTIPLSESDSPPFPPPPLLLVDEESNASSSSKDAGGETTKSEACDSLEEESCKPDKSSNLDIGKGKNGKTASLENKATMDAKLEKDELKTDSDGQEKVLKKPDTIIPCPRCNSLETKFCYYNNYNVNQPRHFCKNCQRYWTAGGTMRNVPPGAGRRKHKNIASEYRHVVASSDGIPATADDTPDLATHQVNSCGELSPPSGTCNGNGTVLKFRPDPALCKSIAAVLNLRSQKRKNEMGVAVCGGNRDEPSSCGSSVSDPTCSKIELPDNEAQMEQDSMSGSCDKPTPLAPPNPLQCYPCSPWAYPWNSGSNSVASMAAGGCSSEMFYGMGSGDLKQVAWGSTPMVVTPTYITPSIPFPFVPASYWGCMNSSWTTGAWNVPWSGSNRDHSPSSYSSISGSSSNSFPTLGKRSREANIEGEGEGKSEKCLWVPKTLRIDDPDEAAKSSIWDTLGIKPGQSELISKGGIFKAFQPKKVVNDDALDATQALQANPAALSRSQKFQESS